MESDRIMGGHHRRRLHDQDTGGVAMTPDAANSYTVSGSVNSPDRAGVGARRVQIVDKNVGQDVPLGESVTDAAGRYRVQFGAASLVERKKQQPDLQARVYAGQTFLGASEVRYNAGTQETLNV